MGRGYCSGYLWQLGTGLTSGLSDETFTAVLVLESPVADISQTVEKCSSVYIDIVHINSETLTLAEVEAAWTSRLGLRLAFSCRLVAAP